MSEIHLDYGHKKNVNRKDTIMIENQDNVLTDQELEQVIGGSHKDGKGGKRPKFKKPCPHCNQSGAPSVLKADGWYCPVCKQKIGAYKGLAKDKAKHPRG